MENIVDEARSALEQEMLILQQAMQLLNAARQRANLSGVQGVFAQAFKTITTVNEVPGVVL